LDVFYGPWRAALRHNLLAYSCDQSDTLWPSIAALRKVQFDHLIAAAWMLAFTVAIGAIADIRLKGRKRRD